MSNMKRLALAALLATVSFAPNAAFAGGKAIAGIVFQQDQYFRGIQIGMEKAAKAAGDELLAGNSDSKLEKEAQLIDTYIARGVNSIVVAPLSADASVPALKKARDAGITVVTYGTSANGDVAQATVTSSDRDIGIGTGKAATDFLKTLGNGEKVKIGMLAFKALLPEQSNARVEGFLSVVSDQVDIVAQQDAWLAEKALAVASDMLTANPGIRVIYAANEGGTIGAVQAVKKAGLEGKVFVFGTDGSEQLANMLLNSDNVLQATTAQQPLEVGKQAIEAAQNLLDGKKIETKVNVPVLPLTRANAEGIAAYKEGLKALK
ncbi:MULTISPECIES: substrate-binding domain-containing protein [Rhizobium/Agrobacterium group]|uniref:Substrate-binding domain-containing protein n=1 Tax=Agrobacterium cucumeris TaxID=2862866 RepID=A0ABY8RR91_9HYPH|nr:MULTISPECIES: substrate-binding domain-containing protein [Rhizobium/Agrobacterium group]MCZ7469156.1 substrate-binding domain-containing protein [Rhizobium rhizogenes]MCZ7483137.1 substrate-binding domain-containing protein [Rhizobium rhizogenes]MCZ7488849.1 substrate-binding domain-containing protein [Rhizobium rhizogenes]MDA5633235.1 substrate-binding domain-containing protein [Agrobacterium sp. ST15.16.024]MDF1888878.1 substrate-binding domain-containing protein [Rhizobium rhizogenes]